MDQSTFERATPIEICAETVENMPREETMNQTNLAPRERMEFDVVIVGAGPAGLAAAIRIKQLSPETTVVVMELSLIHI